jgi:hypothetical protein
MDRLTRYNITHGVSDADARQIWLALRTKGVAHLYFDEQPAPRPAHTLGEEMPRDTKRRRIVISAFYEERELMVAMEANGCAFLQQGVRHNQFTLIQQGFQIGPAARIIEVLDALAYCGAVVEQSETFSYPQITNQAP